MFASLPPLAAGAATYAVSHLTIGASVALSVAVVVAVVAIASWWWSGVLFVSDE